MRILTICPTFNKPNLCRKMVESFHDTIECDNTLVLGIDIGDPQIEAYKQIKEANKILCKYNSTVTKVINTIYMQYPNYDFYHITNDDVIYQTKGWDNKFIKLSEIKGKGIYYGNDLLQGDNLCTFPFISGDIVRSVEWLQLPSLNRYCGDVVWKFIGDNCKCLYYLGNVFIKHNWNGCENIEVNKSDMAEFSKWLPYSQKDINKVMEIL